MPWFLSSLCDAFLKSALSDANGYHDWASHCPSCRIGRENFAPLRVQELSATDMPFSGSRARPGKAQGTLCSGEHNLNLSDSESSSRLGEPVGQVWHCFQVWLISRCCGLQSKFDSIRSHLNTERNAWGLNDAAHSLLLAGYQKLLAKD